MLVVSCIIAGLVQWLLVVIFRAGITPISVVNVLFLIWTWLYVASLWPHIPWEVMLVVGVVVISTLMGFGQRKK